MFSSSSSFYFPLPFPFPVVFCISSGFSYDTMKPEFLPNVAILMLEYTMFKTDETFACPIISC